jgi:deoxyribonucleoside regulator
MTQIIEVDNARLIFKVSSLYYKNGLSQQEISDRLKVSRPKVSRLLKKARELGIVQIFVNIPEDHNIDLELSLEKKFNLNEIIIVEPDVSLSTYPHVDLKNAMGYAAARYLERTVADGDVIGMSWGSTLKAMIENLPPVPTVDVHVIQTLGGVGSAESKDHAMDISRRLASLLDARLTLLQIPGIASSPEIKKALLSDYRLQKSFEFFPRIKTVFVGIGALGTNPILNFESREIPEEVLANILNSPAVGDIGLNFYDIDGNEVDTGLNDLFIGMSLEDYQNVERVVGIAGGPEKYAAVLGALKGGYLDVLITDSATAEKLASEHL